MNLAYLISGASLALNGGLFLYVNSVRKNLCGKIIGTSVLDREYTKAKYDFLDRKAKDYSDALHLDDTRLIRELDDDVTIDLQDLHRQIDELKCVHEDACENHAKLFESHKALTDRHTEMQERQSVIHTLLVDRKAVYVSGSEMATCTACKAVVARYFTRGTDVICANCDPHTYADLSKG